MLITHYCYFLLFLIIVISSTDGFSRCDIKHSSQPESVNCPNKTCSQHIDCWVTYGPPQRCVCDPILCGSVCLPGKVINSYDFCPVIDCYCSDTM
ncbi:unnamed protein product [Trichobilharzia regenti]|nr:unnamed protein product [Trichobilharzia regenti]